VPNPDGTDCGGFMADDDVSRRGLCPRGHYCPEGTVEPMRCSNGTFRFDQGGAVQANCTICQAGFQCVDGDTVMRPCPRGFYCPLGTPPVACPVRTYRDVFFGVSIDDCVLCEPGYLCDQSGLPTYLSGTPCPPGYFCERGVLAGTACPAGTYRDATRARNVSECYGCPGGFRCGNGTVSPVECQGGTYCPEMSVEERECLAGSYCPARTASPVECPASFYCPVGSAQPVMCPVAHFCPRGSAEPILCPLGYQKNDTEVRTSLVDSCIMCPGGFYGYHPQREFCEPCAGGYYCPPGTQHPAQYPCPAGHYCPPQSAAPIPCDRGTYNPDVLRANRTECLSCPENTYTSLLGQTGCRPCGSSAQSGNGSSTCECVGAFRSFQTSDGACVCEAGYVFYDDSGAESTGDSRANCQPLVDERCGSGELRDSATRRCLSEEEATTFCNVFCDGSSLGYNTERGVCECSSLTDTDEVCDVACRANMTTLRSSGSGDGSTILVCRSDGDCDEVEASEVPGLYGSLMCGGFGRTVCLIQPIQMRSNGVYGLVGASDEYLLDKIGSGGGSSRRRRRRRRVSLVDTPVDELNVYASPFDRVAATGMRRAHLHAASGISETWAQGRDAEMPDEFIARRSASRIRERRDTVVEPGVRNPVVCLELGDSVLFDLSAGRDHFPVYYERHLFNTNPTFDFGAFRQLQSTLLTTNLTVSSFAFTFATAGVYVFYDFGEPAYVTVIRVMDASQTCSMFEDARVAPSSTNNLLRSGISQQSVGNVAPDYVLIGALLGTLGAVVLLLVLGSMVMRPRAWQSILPEHLRPVYRRILGSRGWRAGADATGDERLEAAGVRGVGGVAEGSDSAASQAPEAELADFNVRTLFDKLDDESTHVTMRLARYGEDVKANFEQLRTQTEQLRDLVAGLDRHLLDAVREASHGPHAGAEAGSSTGGAVGGRGGNGGGVEAQMAEQSLRGEAEAREMELLARVQQLLDELVRAGVAVPDVGEQPGMLGNSVGGRMPGAASTVSKLQALVESAALAGREPSNDGATAEQPEDPVRVQLERELMVSHMQALADAESDCVAEEDREAAAALEKIIGDRTQAETKATEKLAKSLQSAVTDADVQAALRSHTEALEQIEHTFAVDKTRQLQQLQEKARARREQRMKAVERQSAEAAKVRGIDVGMLPARAGDDRENERRLAERFVATEMVMMEQEREAVVGERAAVESSGDARCDLVRRNLEDVLLEMAARGAVQSNAVDELMTVHERELRAIEGRIGLDRDRQVAAMKDKLRERRKRHLQDQANVHEAERKQLLKEFEEKGDSLSDGARAHMLNDMEARQATERGALEAGLIAAEARAAASIGSVYAEKLNNELGAAQDALIKRSAASGPMSSEDVAAMVARMSQELAEAQESLDLQVDRQKMALQEKLAARRALALQSKLRSDQEAAVRTLLEQQRAQAAGGGNAAAVGQVASGRNGSDAKGGLVVPVVDVVGAVENAQETQALENQQATTLEEMESRHEVEQRTVKEQERRAVEEEERRIRQDLEMRKAQILRERQQRFAAEIEARTDLGDADTKRLVVQHEKELAELERGLQMEMQRQQGTMQEKLQERAKRRLEMLQRRQESEKQRELAEQSKEKAELRSKLTRAAERAALLSGLQNSSGSQAEKVIERVLEQRHQRESRELQEQYELEKRVKVGEALRALEERAQRDREAMMVRHAAEFQQLMALMSDLGPSEAEERRGELVARQAVEASRLEDDMFGERRRIEHQVQAELDMRYAHRRLELREAQYQEFAEAMRELTPHLAVGNSKPEEAEKAAKELETYRLQLEKERADMVKHLETERETYDKQLQAEMKDEMAAIERELEQERAREAEKANRLLQELSMRKERMLEERRAKMQEDLARIGTVSEDERTVLMKQHDEDIQKLENAMDAERLRQQAGLQEKLQRRREEKRLGKLREAEEKMRERMREHDEEQRVRMATMDAETRRKLETGAEVQAIVASAPAVVSAALAPAPLKAEEVDRLVWEKKKKDDEHTQERKARRDKERGTAVEASAVSGGLLGRAGLSESEVVSVIMKSPVYARLVAVESLLREQLESIEKRADGDGTVAGAHGSQSAGDVGEHTGHGHEVRSGKKDVVSSPPQQTKTMARSAKGTLGSDAEGAASSSGAVSAYLDERDQRWSGDKELVPLGLGELSAKEFISYRFGCFVAELLSTTCRFPTVSLLVASKIPSNDGWRGNAYQNSFSWDAKSGIVFIRRQRLETAGELAVALVHVLAHVHSGSMANDSDPKFMREFHRALRVLCDEIFFLRAKRSAETGSGVGDSGGEGRAFVEGLFKRAGKNVDSRNAVVDELVELNVYGADGGDGEGRNAESGLSMDLAARLLSKNSLVERAKEFTQFEGGARLMAYLESLEDRLGDGVGSEGGVASSGGVGSVDDEVERRLSELLAGGSVAAGASGVTGGGTAASGAAGSGGNAGSGMLRTPSRQLRRMATGIERGSTGLQRRSRSILTGAPTMVGALGENGNGEGVGGGDVMAALLEAQIDELQNKVDRVNADVMGEMRQHMDAQERVRELEAQLQGLESELGELEPGSNAFSRKEEAVQEARAQLSRAKGAVSLSAAKLEVCFFWCECAMCQVLFVV
jgi:hypothetical protein